MFKQSLIAVILLSPSFQVFAFITANTVTSGLEKGSSILKASNSSAEEEARRLRQQAEKIRNEVASFDQAKQAIVDAEEQKRERKLIEKKNKRLRYSAEVPILKGNGQEVLERVDFSPRLAVGESYILTVEAELPLGMILGLDEEEIYGATRVDEVAEGSNAKAAGVQVGDIVRAMTACQTTMETPTWQLMVGGIGQPKTKRFMYSADSRPFEEVMDAVSSNRMDPLERPVVLVLERKER